MWKARRFHSVPRHDRVVVFRPCRSGRSWGSQSWLQPPFSARAARPAASEISATTPVVPRGQVALFPESARAATRGTRGIGNSNTSRVARPGRALFPESARAATRGARGIGSSNTSRVARPGRALFPERRLPERAQVSVPVVFFDPAWLLFRRARISPRTHECQTPARREREPVIY